MQTTGPLQTLTGLCTMIALAVSADGQAAAPDLSGDWVVAIQATEISNGTPAYYRLTLNQGRFCA